MMKRRDSIGYFFSVHGSKNLFAEDEGLLTESEDETKVSPPNESRIRPSCVIDEDDSSNSWFILADSEPEENSCDELRDQNNNLVRERLTSRERVNLSLSGLLARVGKAKIQTSRSKCVVKQQESKIFDGTDQVRLKFVFRFTLGSFDSSERDIFGLKNFGNQSTEEFFTFRTIFCG